MKKYHTRLKNINQAVIGEYTVRCNNQQELLRHLRHLNRLIDKAARLRGEQSQNAIVKQ